MKSRSMLGTELFDTLPQVFPGTFAGAQANCPVQRNRRVQLLWIAEREAGRVGAAPDNSGQPGKTLPRDREIDLIRQQGGVVEFDLGAKRRKIAHYALHRRVARVEGDDAAIIDATSNFQTPIKHEFVSRISANSSAGGMRRKLPAWINDLLR